MRKLDRSRPYATVSGAADHMFEQDGICFDNRGHEIGATESTEKPKKVPTIDKRKGTAKDVDPTIPYETHDKPKMIEIRARYTHVSGGKKIPVGTTIAAGKKLIFEAIKEAAA